MLTPQQELDLAYARNQAGTASVEDMKNIAYAKRTMGYTPTAPAVSTTPTVKQIYSDLPTVPTATPTSTLNLPETNPDEPLKKTQKEYEDFLAGNSGVDENKLREDTLAEFQRQIDATNKVYADMLAREVRASQGRTGQDTAIQARRGMLGSDFGAAQSAGVSQTNKELESSVENQRLSAINAIMTDARDAAGKRIEEERKLKKEGLEARLAYYKSAAERRQTSATNAAKTLLAQGLDISALSPVDLSRLTQYYGVDVEDIKYAYAQEKNKPKELTKLGENDVLVDEKGNIVARGSQGENTVTLNEGQKVYKIDASGEYELVAEGGEKDTRTSEQKNYDEAVKGGYDGTFLEFTTKADRTGFTPYQQFTATQTLRKELTQNTASARTVSQQYGLMQEALNRVVTGETKDLNATSQAIITTFNKILDPASVVREGEYDRTAQGQSLINQIEGKIVRLQQGGAGLSVGALQEIVDLGKDLADSYKQYAENQNELLRENARAFGLDANLVTGDISEVTSDEQSKIDQLRQINPNLSDEDIEAILGKPISFNKVGTDTKKGAMRTDRHNNPTAFTVDVAKTAGLVEGRDYEAGDPFPNNPRLRTAKIIGDPVKQTIKVIDRIGFYTQSGQPRWTHTAISNDQWQRMTTSQKAQVIKEMYKKEGGTALQNIFKTYS